MICLVLAAGYATRLYPLTENFPKPLLEVGRKTILNWLVDDVVQLDEVTEIVVISNHKFITHFEKWAASQIYKKKITVLDDGSTDNENRLGAVKDMMFAIDSLNIQDDLLVLAGDNVLDFSIRDFVRFAEEKKTSCVMCHEENDLKKQQKTAIIVKNTDDLIVSYEENPKFLAEILQCLLFTFISEKMQYVWKRPFCQVAQQMRQEVLRRGFLNRRKCMRGICLGSDMMLEISTVIKKFRKFLASYSDFWVNTNWWGPTK